VSSEIIGSAIRAGRFPALVFLVHCVLSPGFNAYDRCS
jgi:hypothetical protein